MRTSLPRSPLALAAVAATGGAVFLALGIFLSVGRDSYADGVVVTSPKDGHKVRVISVDGTPPPVVWVDSDGESGESNGVASSKCGFLGVDVDEDTKSDEGGALVNRVVEDSPAAKAGLKKGDVIVGFNGVVIRGPARLTEQIHAAKPGDTVTLDVRRDGRKQKMQVQMGERPAWSWSWNWSGSDLPGLDKEKIEALEKSLKGLEKEKFEVGGGGNTFKMIGPLGRTIILGTGRPLLGVELVRTTPELREAMGGRKDAGVLIGKILSGSAAERAGLSVGDLVLSVDGDDVADPADLAAAIQDRAGKTVDLEVVRDKRTMHLKADIPEPKEDEEINGPSADARVGCPWSVAPAPPTPPAAPAIAPMAAPAPPPAAPTPPAPAPNPARVTSVLLV